MGFSKWMKQAHELAAEHSDKVHAGIDKAATSAKRKAPDKGSYIDKAATAAKSAVQPKH
ncbi:MAG: antitoxin [Actinobacteria bacterium]|nr:antitoxin [Actinomycetota bacterium]MCB8998245.1 antitoxin [Actinomycetota bacterium]HRY08955.1 Rv0909 family putative TA system antitoxin [Candidatus Nanopelagicales bacterium]